MLEIRLSSVEELESSPHFPVLLAEYAEESATKGLPPPAARLPTYKKLEKVGFLKVIGAFYSGELVGFITVLTNEIPHYGASISVSESYFVAKEYRKTGAGTRLRLAAEELSRRLGALGLFISAVVDSPLAEVLPHCGYAETNRVFFKSFAHE